MGEVRARLRGRRPSDNENEKSLEGDLRTIEGLFGLVTVGNTSNVPH
jgi:hypothetical protein